jgi:hypothetical protein
MEALIGFAVGYWVGTRQGRQGLEHALDAAREIWQSPETRRLLGEGLLAVQGLAPDSGILGKGGRDTRAAIIRGVIDEVVERRYGRKAAAA